MKPTLFFSHSAKDQARCTPLLQALEAAHALRMCYDVRDLAAGHGWREQLGPWLRDCHGGVVLITQNVLDKYDWVLQETTLLNYRASGEGDAFRLFVVADEAAQADPRYPQMFGALALDRVQQLRVRPGADWENDEVPRLAQAIGAEMAKVAPFYNDFHGRLAELLFDALGPLDALDAGQRLLRDTYDANGTASHTLADPRRVLRAMAARRLAHADFGAWHDIEGLFQRLAPVCARAVRHALLYRLQSWWVAVDNAERLAAARAQRYSRAEPLPNLVLLEVDREPETVAQRHVHRRFQPYTAWKWLALAAPETSVDTIASIALALRGRGFCNDPEASLRELVQQLAEDRRAAKAPVFVHLHLGPQAGHVLRAARLFWPCTFVLTAPARHVPGLVQALGLAAVCPPAAGPSYPQALRLTRAAEGTDDLAGALA